MPRGRLVVLLATLALLVPGFGSSPAAPAAAAGRLPSYLSLQPSVRQLLTVTAPRWSSTRASLRVWRRTDHGWRLVRGPVRVALGWNGFAPAGKRRQGTGTTPAGRFALPYAFGNRPDPGGRVGYRRVDRNDYWPYEPRDPRTYNVYQRHKAAKTRWRRDYAERLASYGREYAHSIVVGFNLPRGVHYSRARRQWVAREPADTRRGGGIFLHVRERRYTAGCVSAPLRDVRWIVRWLDPRQRPRIVMGPTAWVRRRF